MCPGLSCHVFRARPRAPANAQPWGLGYPPRGSPWELTQGFWVVSLGDRLPLHPGIGSGGVPLGSPAVSPASQPGVLPDDSVQLRNADRGKCPSRDRMPGVGSPELFNGVHVVLGRPVTPGPGVRMGSSQRIDERRSPPTPKRKRIHWHSVYPRPERRPFTLIYKNMHAIRSHR